MSNLINYSQRLLTKPKTGFSSLELLTTLLILAMLSLSFLPQWQGFSHTTELKLEARQILSFLQIIRHKANLSNSRWTIELHQNLEHSKLNSELNSWCIISYAGKSKPYAPSDKLCSKSLKLHGVMRYQPFFSQTTLASKGSYPKVITTFDGVRGNTKSNNFVIRSGNLCLKFIFSNLVAINTELKKC